MTGRQDQGGNRYDRALDPEEPGAHSGSESQARERSVPGTASAAEGYRPDRGTTAGKPLEGVEAPEDGTGSTEDGGDAGS